MGVLRKAYPVSLRTLDEAKGQVEALVSVFGNVDLIGDRVVKGAFTKSIEKWKASGFPVPVVFSHDWGDLWSHVGAVDSLEETDKGLKAVYTLDIADNPAAAQVYRLMKRGTLKEHSFAYETKDERTGKDGANELLELDIIEIGPTLKGMNPDTEVLAVKSALEKVDAEHAGKEEAGRPTGKVGSTGNSTGPHLHVETKAGRFLSKADETELRNAMESIAQVLSSLDEENEKADEAEAEDKSVPTDEVDGKASGDLLSLITQIESLKKG